MSMIITIEEKDIPIFKKIINTYRGYDDPGFKVVHSIREQIKKYEDNKINDVYSCENCPYAYCAHPDKCKELVSGCLYFGLTHGHKEK